MGNGAHPLNVKCPKCSAAAAVGCHNMQGGYGDPRTTIKGFHAERVALAEKELRSRFL